MSNEIFFVIDHETSSIDDICFDTSLPRKTVVLHWPFVEHDNYEKLVIYNDWAFRVQRPVYLNDTLVEFAVLHYLLEEIKHLNREPYVFFFSPLFHSKLKTEKSLTPEERYSTVRNWSSSVNKFKKNFLIFQINRNNLHWFSIAILRPTFVFSSIGKDWDHSLPCILIMDSMSDHKNLSYYKDELTLIRDYLVQEWLAKSCTFMQRHNKEVTTASLNQKWAKVKTLILRTPQQPNDVDCGVYMIRNNKNLMAYIPRSTQSIINDGFATFLSECHYTQQDIVEERTMLNATIMSLIDSFQSRELAVSSQPPANPTFVDIQNELSLNIPNDNQSYSLVFSIHELKILYTDAILQLILQLLFGIDKLKFNQSALLIQKILTQESVHFNK